MLNQSIITGRLTKDTELRKVNDRSVVSFTLHQVEIIKLKMVLIQLTLLTVSCGEHLLKVLMR